MIYWSGCNFCILTHAHTTSQEGVGDSNDVWEVDIVGGASDDPLRTVVSRLRLKHVNIGCYLHSHGTQLPKWLVTSSQHNIYGRSQSLNYDFDFNLTFSTFYWKSFSHKRTLTGQFLLWLEKLISLCATVIQHSACIVLYCSVLMVICTLECVLKSGVFIRDGPAPPLSFGCNFTLYISTC